MAKQKFPKFPHHKYQDEEPVIVHAALMNHIADMVRKIKADIKLVPIHRCKTLSVHCVVEKLYLQELFTTKSLAYQSIARGHKHLSSDGMSVVWFNTTFPPDPDNNELRRLTSTDGNLHLVVMEEP